MCGTTPHPSACGHLVRGHLAVGQGAVREVPQRTLAGHRLVDDPDAVDLAHEGRVGGGHHPALENDLAPLRHHLRGAGAGAGGAHCSRRRNPLARTHRWPSGSTGLPQNGQGGRPASTTCSARAQNARATPGGDPHQQQLVGLGLLEGLLGELVELIRRHHGGLAEREDLDHHPLVPGVPGQGHGAGPELLVDRLLQRPAVVQVDRRDRRDQGVAHRAGHQLVEKLVDPLDQGDHLLLLQRDADQPPALAGLEEEGPLPGLADRPGDEALGRIEGVHDSHVHHPRSGRQRLSPGPLPADHRVLGRAPPRRAGGQPGQVAGVGVDAEHERATGRVAHACSARRGRPRSAGTGPGACRGRRRGSP